VPGPLACQEEKLDIWWAKVANTGKYPLLPSVVKAVLSCFHGPMVEGNFSVMGDILDDSSPNMRIETYSSMQTVKYELLSKGQTSVEMFFHKDPKHAKVNQVLCQNLRQAYRKSQETKQARKSDLHGKQLAVGLTASTVVPISKKRFRETIEGEAEALAASHGSTIHMGKKKTLT